MFAKNIKYLRKQKGYTQKQLADKLGYNSLVTVNRWESGVNAAPYNKLLEIARLFNVTVDELTGVDLEKKENDTNTPHEAVRIKVYGSVPAGVPQEAIEDIAGWEDIPVEWTTGGREYFGLKVKGASMEPKYLAGDTIIVRKQSDCENGQDAVVYVNGYDATLKRVLKSEAGIILQALNPAYETKTYTDTPITIAGVVVEIRRTV